MMDNSLNSKRLVWNCGRTKPMWKQNSSAWKCFSRKIPSASPARNLVGFEVLAVSDLILPNTRRFAEASIFHSEHNESYERGWERDGMAVRSGLGCETKMDGQW